MPAKPCGQIRDGMPVRPSGHPDPEQHRSHQADSLGLEATEADRGSDQDLIVKLQRWWNAAGGDGFADRVSAGAPLAAPAAAPATVEGTLVANAGAAIAPGEVSLDELERAFRETPTEVVPPPCGEGRRPSPRPLPGPAKHAPQTRCRQARRGASAGGDKSPNQSIRSMSIPGTSDDDGLGAGADRNQLLEISRRNEDTEFKVPPAAALQRHRELQEAS